MLILSIFFVFFALSFLMALGAVVLNINKVNDEAIIALLLSITFGIMALISQGWL